MRGNALGLLILSLGVAGCGARTGPYLGASGSADASAGDGAALDSGTVSFPVGTYTDCALGRFGASLSGAGFEPDAVLALEQSGARVTATYVDEGGTSHSLAFAVKTGTSATLAPAGQAISGYTNLCVMGVGVSNEKPIPAHLDASAGALTYDSGTVFITATGMLHDDVDPAPCAPESTPADFWLLCQKGPSTAPVGTKISTPIPHLPVGSYSCTSQIETFYQSGGQKQYVASGGLDEALVVSQAGAQVTAAYDNASSLSGTLHLDVTSATTASLAKAQTAVVPCLVPTGTIGGPPATPGTLDIEAGSLMVDGSTLFLSFAGSMNASSSCAGARKAGTLICSKK